MAYKIALTDMARKQLKKMDPHVSKLLIHWMRKNLDGCEDPRQHGKGLTANRSGQWRYRVGDYRILANIDDEIVPILVLSAARRREVY